MAIAQTTFATDASGENQALRQMLEPVEHEERLMQDEVLRTWTALPAMEQRHQSSR